MSTTKEVGSPGPANEEIGGVPTIHYFNFQSHGRGTGLVRLMWEDAGIAYEDVHYTFDEYAFAKESTINQLKAERCRS